MAVLETVGMIRRHTPGSPGINTSPFLTTIRTKEPSGKTTKAVINSRSRKRGRVLQASYKDSSKALLFFQETKIAF